MQHNTHNSAFRFVQAPESFNRFTEKSLLQYCLGATLYMPGTRQVVDKLVGRSFPALKSMVMCFEDAIRAEEVQAAEDNVLSHLSMLKDTLDQGVLNDDDIPLIFLRVRDTRQFAHFAQRIDPDQAQVLSGFVFPKFYSDNAGDYLDELTRLNARLDRPLYGMPIFEGKAIAYRESRTSELSALRDILARNRELILNIRVGGTDFSALFGVRRGINASIYDILPVRDALADILNMFNRPEDGYTVSGPVWEYFLAYKQDDIQKLLDQNIHKSLGAGQPILNDAIDGLLKEVLLDKANGFVGKTVIHPSHIRFVNALQAVTREEFEDACQILGKDGGVCKSAANNKMNEMNPHRNWAGRIILRARAYGVIEHEGEYMKLLLGQD
ncbi:MAG: HpcH/HpaI aldolase/citrate lyase family protein [Wenzhouxiangella sp.]